MAGDFTMCTYSGAVPYVTFAASSRAVKQNDSKYYYRTELKGVKSEPYRFFGDVIRKLPRMETSDALVNAVDLAKPPSMYHAG
ncbi:High-affinity glucose transporter RGT2 [Fusarium oxysporum f. sp. albedinis]|nr:High-affinity glucose transporter RGT2 [Fusarium oxysporum f. sp. albedinis]